MQLNIAQKTAGNFQNTNQQSRSAVGFSHYLLSNTDDASRKDKLWGSSYSLYQALLCWYVPIHYFNLHTYYVSVWICWLHLQNKLLNQIATTISCSWQDTDKQRWMVHLVTDIWLVLCFTYSLAWNEDWLNPLQMLDRKFFINRKYLNCHTFIHNSTKHYYINNTNDKLSFHFCQTVHISSMNLQLCLGFA